MMDLLSRLENIKLPDFIKHSGAEEVEPAVKEAICRAMYRWFPGVEPLSFHQQHQTGRIEIVARFDLEIADRAADVAQAMAAVSGSDVLLARVRGGGHDRYFFASAQLISISCRQPTAKSVLVLSPLVEVDTYVTSNRYGRADLLRSIAREISSYGSSRLIVDPDVRQLETLQSFLKSDELSIDVSEGTFTLNGYAPEFLEEPRFWEFYKDVARTGLKSASDSRLNHRSRQIVLVPRNPVLSEIESVLDGVKDLPRIIGTACKALDPEIEEFSYLWRSGYAPLQSVYLLFDKAPKEVENKITRILRSRFGVAVSVEFGLE